MPSPKTALLVIDMQRVFEPMTTNALANIKKLISHYQSISAPVIFTQHGHSQEELTTVPSPNQLVRKWGPDGSIASGSKKWELQDDIQNYLDNKVDYYYSSSSSSSTAGGWPKVVHKNTYDAFLNTDLAKILEEAKVERTVICGVMTDCCCDTTARSAFNRGYETWLVNDACGTANDAQHKASLRGCETAIGEILTTKEVIERLKDEA